ncbi:aliphatic sulfonate ABC transporter substrate-binding protein [Asaia siamensis]|uniref:aliphatic sulfonate ABC transporter substrate-binding protein n=1 Tax=Asaia siamensis TaxID=110479 RepID=UPI00166B5AB9|nr:aliphatic sulfonate ABC transporter substrate-binding protein [Asaia siamensis]
MIFKQRVARPSLRPFLARPYPRLAHRVAALAALVVGATTCAAQAETLVVADQRGMQRALLQAAHADKDLGFDIRWVEFDAAAPLLQALGAGAVDLGIAGDGPYLFAWAAGIPARAVLLLPPRGGGHMTAIIVPAQSPVHSLSNLAGRKIATGRGSIGHLLALSLFDSASGKHPDYVFLPPSQAKSALDSGAVDAWATWEPYVTLAAAQTGARVVADGQNVMPNNGFMVASTRAITDKHPQIAVFLKRITQAYGWGRAHPQEFAALLSHQTGLPPDVANKVAQEQITAPGPITNETVNEEARVIATYRKAQLVNPSRKLDDAFDRSFVP